MQLLFLFDQDTRIEKTLIQTLACQLLSTLMQLLLSFDQDMSVEKTLIPTLACQLSLTLMQLLFLFDQDTRNLRKLSYKLSLVNSRLSTLACQLLFSFDQDMKVDTNSHTNSRLSTPINSHATLVLVLPGQELKNSHTNPCSYFTVSVSRQLFYTSLSWFHNRFYLNIFTRNSYHESSLVAGIVVWY